MKNITTKQTKPSANNVLCIDKGPIQNKLNKNCNYNELTVTFDLALDQK